MTERTGVLVVNVGTPDAPRPPEARRFLREFLSDPRVLDIPAPVRRLLLELWVLPRRPARSAEAWAKIWTSAGSPLAVFGRELVHALAARLEGRSVRLAMRYGSPSIADGMRGLEEDGCTKLVVLPLYPQYASSSTGSALERVYAAAGKRWNTPFLTVVAPFYDEPGFVRSFAEVGRSVIDVVDPHWVLFSYHGLPERHVRKSDPTRSHCLASASCCDAIGSANRSCYRAQCFATTRAIASALALDAGRTSTSFQSRLGRTPWIRPYTDEVVVELARKGVKRLVVFCPSFVADCLETLEEIGMRAEADFRAAGGDVLRLVPSLNAHDAWVDALAELVQRAEGGSRYSQSISG